MTATQAALKELELTGEYEGADMSVGLRAGWTFAVSDDNYQTIKSALVNAERVQGLVEALEKLSSEITFERSENNFGQGNWIVNQAGYAAFQNLFQALAAFNAGRDEGDGG